MIAIYPPATSFRYHYSVTGPRSFFRDRDICFSPSQPILPEETAYGCLFLKPCCHSKLRSRRQRRLQSQRTTVRRQRTRTTSSHKNKVLELNCLRIQAGRDNRGKSSLRDSHFLQIQRLSACSSRQPRRRELLAISKLLLISARRRGQREENATRALRVKTRPCPPYH